MVVEAEIFPAVLTCLKDQDEYVRKNVATLIREIAKHTPELSQLIVNAGGVAAVVDYVGESKGNVRLPGVMMLGYVAAHSENLAMAVIVSKVGLKILYTFHNIHVDNSPQIWHDIKFQT